MTLISLCLYIRPSESHNILIYIALREVRDGNKYDVGLAYFKFKRYFPNQKKSYSVIAPYDYRMSDMDRMCK